MEYYGALLRYAWPMLQVQEDAEDAVHDAFLKSWTRLDRLDCARGQYSTWLFAITRNCCLDRLRNRKRRPTSSIDITLYELMPGADPTIDPEGMLAHHDLQTEIMGLVASLSATYRETIVLHYWNDLSVNEIADITQTSVSNVKSRLYRGRLRIAELYAERYPQHAQTQGIAPVPILDALLGQPAAS